MTPAEVQGIDVPAVRKRLGFAMRGVCGRGGLSMHDLASITGDKEKKLWPYRDGLSTPSTDTLLRLFAALPPEFANQLLGLAGLGGAYRLEGSADTLTLNAEVTRLAAMIGEHLKDGKVCHRETAEQVAAVRKLAGICHDFIQANEGRTKLFVVAAQ